MIIVDRFEYRRQRSALFQRYFWAPYLEQQDHARIAAFVPCFMFKTVVENQRFTRTPASCFVADAKSATLRDDQWNVAD